MEGQDHGHPPAWQPRLLADRAVAALGGWSVWYAAETGSTNADLLARADAPDRYRRGRWQRLNQLPLSSFTSASMP